MSVLQEEGESWDAGGGEGAGAGMCAWDEGFDDSYRRAQKEIVKVKTIK